METTMTLYHEPVDVLRQGLPSAKSDAQAPHPLQAKLKSDRIKERKEKIAMLGNVYGTAFPLRNQIEEQMLSSVQRLPGLPSSNLGAEALSGKLDDFDFSDYLTQRPEESEVVLPDTHSVMEHKLGLSKTVPARALP